RPPDDAAALHLPAKLRWYYARLFPLSQLARWLQLGPDHALQRREISLTLPAHIFVRWNSFANPEDLHTRLTTAAPLKLDIGAVYNRAPCKRYGGQGPLVPCEKEFVLDVDITDYADVLPPAAAALSPTAVCDAYWCYMALAVRLLHDALRRDFGFNNILCVYSGRRGVHCWVADRRARALSNEQRTAVADYLHLNPNASHRRALTHPLHPALQHAKPQCTALFHQLLQRKLVLCDHAALTPMLKLVPSAAVRAAILRRVQSAVVVTPAHRWHVIETEVTRAARTDYALRTTLDAIVFRYTYPRLDVNVSRDMGHLLKAPFCVHPATGRVCVPFRADRAHEFDPARDAPVLDGLLAEMRQGDGEMTRRLKRAVDVFELFVAACEREARSHARAVRLDAIDARAVAHVMSN
ncbi:unnamed protein product, partial [Agarophyton chilense]